jgi:non-homologous end joining protein Ku
LIDAKLEGKTVAPTPKREKAPVIDMMEALKRSLGEGRRAAGGRRRGRRERRRVGIGSIARRVEA